VALFVGSKESLFLILSVNLALFLDVKVFIGVRSLSTGKSQMIVLIPYMSYIAALIFTILLTNFLQSFIAA
jgi:hypothetical protein